jgi:serine/threonine protein kinase
LAKPLTGDDPREVAGYQLRARLGAGGMGRVYLALTRAGRPVAIKVVRAEFGDDEEFRDRFRQEVVAAQRVHGLYTAQVIDADPDAPQPWLATAYVPGLSLQQAVTEHGPLPSDSVFLLVAGVAEALQAIHAVGIVHRDLKPSNVILAADGPRVIDFGIAWAATAPALTRSGISVGSPPFMAPEQARGQPTTPTVDVFALGSLATFAVAGHPPFGVDEAVQVLHRVLNEQPNLDGCPPDLRQLIERCLVKNPADRPQTSEIIDTCRARTVNGGLAFERSWLPASVFAVAVGGTGGVPPTPVFSSASASGPQVVAPGESTFPSETSYPAGGDPDEGTVSGEVRDPPARSGAAASGAGMPHTGDHEPPDAAAAAGPVPGDPGHAGSAGAGEEALLAAGMAGPPGPEPRSGAPPDGRNRRKRTLVSAAAAAALLVAAAVVGVALLSHPVDDQASAVARPPRSSSTADPPSTPSHRASGSPTTAHSAPPGSSLPGPGPSAGQKPGGAASQAPKTSGASPPPAPSGQAAFAGTWDGTVSQPAGDVASWTVELDIPASGTAGSYSAPSLGCSGTLKVKGTAASSMTAVAKTTSDVNTGCVAKARLTLTLSGPAGIDMVWTPVGHAKEIGTATLASS